MWGEVLCRACSAQAIWGVIYGSVSFVGMSSMVGVECVPQLRGGEIWKVWERCWHSAAQALTAHHIASPPPDGGNAPSGHGASRLLPRAGRQLLQHLVLWPGHEHGGAAVPAGAGVNINFTLVGGRGDFGAGYGSHWEPRLPYLPCRPSPSPCLPLFLPPPSICLPPSSHCLPPSSPVPPPSDHHLCVHPLPHDLL